jgi:hypothetical protein
MQKLKFQSFLLTKNHVVGMTKALKKAGLKVNIDKDAGTVEAYFDDTQVFVAIEKGQNQPWIVRHVVDLFE